jgi:hypothetical protein
VVLARLGLLAAVHFPAQAYGVFVSESTKERC